MSINPFKTKSIKELGEVDVSAIEARLGNISEEFWIEQNKKKPNKFYEFYDTKHIIFKFVHNLNDCTKYYEFPIWEDWKTDIMPILLNAVKPYGYKNGEFSRIMLAKLSAGGNIKAHIDGNSAATFPHKIHIPIQTNKDVKFFVNPKMYHFEKGKAYEVNNLAPHYVENLGQTDRIHLIFEYFNPEHIPANSSFSIKADEDI